MIAQLMLVALVGVGTQAPRTPSVDSSVPTQVDAEILSVSQAMQRLDAASPTLELAQLRFAAAQAALDHVRVALLPKFGLGGNYTFNHAEATLSMAAMFDGIEQGLAMATGRPVAFDRSGVPADVVLQSMHRIGASARLTIPILVAPAIAELRNRRRELQAERWTIAAQRGSLRAALLQMTWSLHSAHAQVDIARRALANAKGHESSAQRLVEAGEGTTLAINIARTQVLRREFACAQLGSQVEAIERSLGALLGQDRPVAIELPARGERTLDFAALWHRALQDQPSLRAEKVRADVGQRRRDATRLRWVPVVTASAGAQVASVAFITGDPYAITAGVDLSWSIYDGGASRATRQSAEFEIRAAHSRTRALELSLQTELREALRRIELADEGARMAAAEVELARSAATSAQRQFTAGGLESLAVLDALDRLNEAEIRHEDSQLTRDAGWVDIDRITGALSR